MRYLLIIDSIELIDKAIKDNKILLIYFGNTTWGVCIDLKPKVLALLKKYPGVEFIYVDVDKSHKLAVHYNIFTIPGILLYVDGKESIREARHISISDFDSKINRYYNMLFD